jgi:Ca-activated chloride channel homolog
LPVTSGPRRSSLAFPRMRLLTSAVVLAIAASLQAQQPPPNFSSESQLVVLHVSVRDKKGAYVGGLDQNAFHVFENNRQQPISLFTSQDAPVTVGLLIDSSGSMGPNREMVIAAAMAFARTSNPSDEMFVLGFNERINRPFPDTAPFTNELPTLARALGLAIKARGQTAIYDAVNEGLQYLKKGQFDRQVLVAVSDGGDNASSATRDQVLANAQASNAVIYTVALVDPMDLEADPGFLSQLSTATGGEAFRPKDIGQVGDVLRRIARDIRNMYTIGYVPPATKLAKGETLRRVNVDAMLGGRKLKVRTRRAYLAADNAEASADAR